MLVHSFTLRRRTCVSVIMSPAVPHVQNRIHYAALRVAKGVRLVHDLTQQYIIGRATSPCDEVCFNLCRVNSFLGNGSSRLVFQIFSGTVALCPSSTPGWRDAGDVLVQTAGCR